MLVLNSKLKTYSVTLPTDISEVNNNYFDNLLKDIKLAPNYSIVAICYVDRLFSVVSDFKNNAGSKQANVIPLIAKLNDTENNLSFKQGDIVICNPTELEMGTHLSLKQNAISLANVANYVIQDKELYNDVISGRFFNDGKSLGAAEAKTTAPDVIFVEFKIVPNCAIKGSYSPKENIYCTMKEHYKSDLK